MATGARSGRERGGKTQRASAPTAVRPTPGGVGAIAPEWSHRLALFVAGVAIVVTPAVYDIAARDSFRIPKALFFEIAALASLLLLSLDWSSSARLSAILRAPVVVAVGPLLAVGTLVSLASPHSEHVVHGLAGLWVGGLTLWGWSVGFSRRELSKLLGWLLVPASLLGLIGALQLHDLYEPFQFETLRQSSRLAITSLAGNAGDLGAFLVLPALVAQHRLALGKTRVGAAVALALSIYGVAASQTFAAVAALGVGTALFWGTLLPVRRRILALAAAALLLALALALSAPFRARATEKAGELANGRWNELLTGRLDGWSAAIWMLEEHPLTGVGAGAFRTEFLPAKEALVDRGVRFFGEQYNVVFANAHNEALEVAAELGWPGFAALVWAVAWTLVRARKMTSGGGEGARDRTIDRGFAWGALAAIAVLSMFHFPFRIAIVGSGILLFLAWLYASDAEASS